MSFTHPPKPKPAQTPTPARLLAVLGALRAFGMVIVRRIHAVAMSAPDAPIDTAGFARASRAVMWAAALDAVISGHLRIVARPRHPKPNAEPAEPAIPAPRPRAPRPAPAPAPAIALSSAMRTAFAKHPIGVIAARICRTLRVTRASDLWAEDVLATQMTPAEWSATHFPISQPTPRRRPARAARPEPTPLPATPKPAAEPPAIPPWRPPPQAPTRRQRLLNSTITPISLPFPLPAA